MPPRLEGFMRGRMGLRPRRVQDRDEAEFVAGYMEGRKALREDPSDAVSYAVWRGLAEGMGHHKVYEDICDRERPELIRAYNGGYLLGERVCGIIDSLSGSVYDAELADLRSLPKRSSEVLVRLGAKDKDLEAASKLITRRVNEALDRTLGYRGDGAAPDTSRELDGLSRGR